MSAVPRAAPTRSPDQVVLGQLLHSLSQPLTSLRCSLELSTDEGPVQQQQAVSIALEQTDRAIGVVRLMREYLDSESAPLRQRQVTLRPVLYSVLEQLSSVAVERQIQLHVEGICTCTVALAEPRLRLVLQYLIGSLIEEPSCARSVTLKLEDEPSESTLRADVEHGSCAPVTSRLDPVRTTIRHVQLAIASRLLESAGASLTFARDDAASFLIRFPRASQNRP